MNVLVTGATGFIGRRLIAHLGCKPGFDLTAIARSPPEPSLPCRTIRLAGPSPDDLRQVVLKARPDAIVHLAAAGVEPGDRDVTRLTELNALWASVLVRAAADASTKSVVIAGSSAEYARNTVEAPIGEEALLESRKLYGATKAAGSLLALATGATLSVDVAVLRLFNVFGHGESPHRLLPSIVSAADAGRTVALSEGTQVRDFIEVNDACVAIESALLGLRERTLPSGAYNVCSGVGTTVAQFARGVATVLQVDPALLRFGALAMRPDDLPWLVGDPGRFLAETGWRARDLEVSIAHAVAGFRTGACLGFLPANDGR